MTEKTAKITYGNQEFEYPTITGTEDETAIDISTLRKDSGLITLDYGYMNTGSTESSICFIDGDKGILRYRGYDITDLADNSTFLETAWLLIYGELPTITELDDFLHEVKTSSMLHEEVKSFFDGFPRDAHPMAILSSVLSALSTFYQGSHDPHDEVQVQQSLIRLIAKIPTIAAYSYKKSIGQPFVYPNNSLDYVENFMHMMFSVPTENYRVRPVMADALKLLLILHADHEQNCSTSTVRMVGSSDANMFASISAGINALWGPLHGGANQSVLEMLEKIRDEFDGDVQRVVNMAKNKETGFRLFGFGHRVYKNYDPRAKILKAAADDVLKELDSKDELLRIAKELEQHALEDEYFIERKLYPNVDFYSGLIYRALGFPTEMFPVLFAMGRLPGWIAHWKEMMETPKTKIGRPRQVYTGENLRDYIRLSERI